ncbi:MAG: GH1 family beta-glucosidase [Sandaracinaceae bacterium]
MPRSLPLAVLTLSIAAYGCGGETPAADAYVPAEDAATDAFVEIPDAGRDAARPDGGPPTPRTFGAVGPIRGGAGRGGFRFGVATAATQIEETNMRTDWWAWTAPTTMGGLGNGTYVGDAVRGYANAQADVDLLEDLNLDAYRFSIEWARIEPNRDQIDMDAVQHYRELLMTLRERGIRPMVTIHHFSNPLWVDDPRIDPETCTPDDAQLCGWGHSGPELVEELAEHAALLAALYGDLVDEWCTINEPVNYLFAAYGAGQFPPGRNWALNSRTQPRFLQVVQTFIDAHVAMYRAIHEYDTVDADDGDGVNASVGIPLSVANWVPTRRGAPSADPEDVRVANRFVYVYHYLLPDALLDGTWDPDLDPTTDDAEPRPDWAGTLDWLGVQYYFRAGVTSRPAVLTLLGGTPCVPPLLDGGACLDELGDPTFYVPAMRYEFYAPGFYDVVMGFHERYGARGLPLLATEAGIATEVGARRAENVVRILEQIGRLLDAGVDFRGYYHWSLMDNFEWAEGYEPKFGLYHVDRASPGYDRIPTLGATVYGEVAGGRALTEAHRTTYGGLGPMTPEP